MQDSSDPEGLRVFYYLVQDLKALVFSLISLHFKVRKGWQNFQGIVDVNAMATDQANLSVEASPGGVVCLLFPPANHPEANDGRTGSCLFVGNRASGVQKHQLMAFLTTGIRRTV